MASTELQRLWNLARVDRQIGDIRSKAAHLDVGQRAQAALDKLDAEYQEAKGAFKSVEQELTDLELKQKGDEQKLQRIKQQIYGGKTTNPKEIVNLERESEMVGKHRDTDMERILELYEKMPPLEAAFQEIDQKVQELVRQRDERRKAAMGEKSALEQSFKEISSKRAEAVKGISAGLLARYENIRQHHGGIGMVEVVLRTGNCGGCGTHLPERTITLLREDRVAVCEDCHRLLYYTEGVV